MSIAAALDVLIGADDRDLQRTLRDSDKGIKGFAKGAEKRLSSLGGSLMQVGGGLTALTAPMIAFGAQGLRVAAEFDSVMTEISARTGIVGDDLESIRQIAIRSGADTVFSATEAADAFLDLTSSGQSAQQAMGTLPHVLNLAAAGSLDLGTAADTVTDVMAMFGLGIDEASQVTDALSAAAGSSSASVSDLGQGMSNVGGVASNFGLSVEETAAALAILSESGIKGAEGGTALRSMLLEMQAPTEKNAAAWAELGTSMYDAQGNARPLETVLDEMGASLAAMPAEEQNRIMQELAGSYGINALSALLAAGGMDTMLDSMDNATSAADVAQAKMDTFEQTMNSLKGSVETLMIQALTPLMNDVLKPLVQDSIIPAVNAVTDWIAANPALVTQLAKIAIPVLALGPALLVVGGAMSALAPVVGALGVGIAALLSPVGLLIAGGAALAYIFRDNLVSTFSELKTQFALAASTGVGFFTVFEDGSTRIGAVLEALGLTSGVAQKIGVAFVSVGQIFKTIGQQIKLAASTGVGFFAVFEDGSTRFGEIAAVISEQFSKIGTLLTSVFQNINWDGLAQAGIDAVGSLFKGISTALSTPSEEGGFDLGALITGALQMNLDFATWITDNIILPMGTAFLNADYTPLIEGSGMLMGAIFNQLTSAFAEGGTWVMDNIITPLGNALLNADYSGLAAGAITFGTNLFTAIADNLPDVANWVVTHIIEPMAEALKGLAAVLATGINDAIPDEFGFDMPSAEIPGSHRLPGGPWTIGGARLGFDLPDNPVPVPAFAEGGFARANQLSLIGERGPELFVPGRSGNVISNSDLANMGGSTYNIVAYGDSPAEVFDMLRREGRNRAPR